ncbi:MAG: sugar phosphate isomerase/epimerase [Opitutales bacterium]|nr:sugar phosphate isomerase/epimerase [Opitutales bacterium]
MLPGLVSITFRDKTPTELIALAKENHLAAIEWGGDQHVPHGDIAKAREIGEATRAAGLAVSSYGSYYRAGEQNDDPNVTPEKVVETAVALGAPAIRIWAGKQRHNTATPEYRQKVTKECRQIADLAARSNLEIHLEYHDWTLTNDPASAQQLLQDVDRPNFFSLWQPPNGASLDECRKSLATILPFLAHVHVFHWGKGWKDRFPLAEGKERWRQYFALIDGVPPREPRYALLEFVRNDDPDQFRTDAQTLQQWLQGNWE